MFGLLFFAFLSHSGEKKIIGTNKNRVQSNMRLRYYVLVFRKYDPLEEVGIKEEGVNKL